MNKLILESNDLYNINSVDRYKLYYNNIVRPQMVNRFKYLNIHQVPKLESITLSFDCGNSKLLSLVCLIALESISGQKAVLVKKKKKTKHSKNNYLCRVTLRKDCLFHFLERYTNIVLPRIKDDSSYGISPYFYGNKGECIFNIKNVYLFPEIESEYELFQQLPTMTFKVKTTSNNVVEMKYLLRSLNLILL
uniref:ribosomal protein L5 n=1 Tax=Meteora sporadica TaxID=2913902 RepID=UPI003002A1B2|nr:ribosomal protein L5 [Meteora sporadica]